MRKILTSALLLALAGCDAFAAGDPPEVAIARDQLLAMAQDPAGARVDGVEVVDVAGEPGPAVCGRVFDPGSGKGELRFVFDPATRQVAVDPSEDVAQNGADTFSDACDQARANRSMTAASVEAVCRPAAQMDVKARLQSRFNDRFAALCS